MSDLSFSINLNWQGTGRDGEGSTKLSGQTVNYSGPESMGGKGTGTCPEELLLAAVGSCYSATLLSMLKKKSLSVDEVSVQVEGIVTGFPIKTKFATLLVNPTIHGGDLDKKEEYTQLATVARDKCFIGKTIAGNVSYEVGNVQVL